eukprot:365661-Chlamydomonas_euryale.AAC.76
MRRWQSTPEPVKHTHQKGRDPQLSQVAHRFNPKPRGPACSPASLQPCQPAALLKQDVALLRSHTRALFGHADSTAYLDPVALVPRPGGVGLALEEKWQHRQRQSRSYTNEQVAPFLAVLRVHRVLQVRVMQLHVAVGNPPNPWHGDVSAQQQHSSSWRHEME